MKAYRKIDDYRIDEKILKISSRAETAMSRLSDDDQKKVFNNLQKVFKLGLKPPYAAKLRGLDKTFIIRAGLDLRIIFQVETKSIRIIDIVRHDKLKELAALSSEKGSTK